MSSQLDRLRAVATEDLQRVHAWWRAANYLSVGRFICSTPPFCVTIRHGRTQRARPFSRAD